jgi:hypothetical protein
VEIAQILGTTESTIRSRLFRARKLLSNLLGPMAGLGLGQSEGRTEIQTGSRTGSTR